MPHPCIASLNLLFLGVVSTITSSSSGSSNGFGTSAQINTAWGLALSTSGKMYVADFHNSRVRLLDTNGRRPIDICSTLFIYQLCRILFRWILFPVSRLDRKLCPGSGGLLQAVRVIQRSILHLWTRLLFRCWIDGVCCLRMVHGLRMVSLHCSNRITHITAHKQTKPQTFFAAYQATDSTALFTPFGETEQTTDQATYRPTYRSSDSATHKAT
jgi:hypothetical protein